MNLEEKILEALENRPLSTKELVNSLEGIPIDEINAALYQLREQKYMIQKHPVIGGGCTTCACSVTYTWRLTIKGRQELSNVQRSG